MQSKLGPASHQHSALLSALARPIPKVQSPNHFKSAQSPINEKKLEAIRRLFNEAVSKQTEQSKTIHLPFKNYHVLNSKWQVSSPHQPLVLLSQDEKSICFHPNNAGYFETHAARFNKPLRVNAFTYWQMRLDRSACTGTSVMIGLGQRDSSLILDGYTDLLGADSKSWGLSIKGHTLHKGQSSLFCDALSELETNTIGCLFDGYRGSLAFFVNGQFKGVAFRDIPLNKRNEQEFDLYPMVSSTTANSVLTIENVYESFPSLQELCSAEIQKDEKLSGANILSRSVFKRYF
jgi:hypothetical protein